MRKIGVLAVHGIGYYSKQESASTAELSFSKGMKEKLFTQRQFLRDLDHPIAWREATYSFALDRRQRDLVTRLGHDTGWRWLRAKILTHLADAAAYQKDPGKDTTYTDYHHFIDRAVNDLANDIGPDGVMVVIAHSLGGHVMSNYIWDRNKAQSHNGGDPLRGMQQVAAFITMGCNIPVFTFAWRPQDVYPLSRPAAALPEPLQKLKPWWVNLYDKDDVLGFPLRKIGPHYEALFEANELEDIEVNAGNWLERWNPASHVAYWQDKACLTEISATIKKVAALAKA